MRIDSQPVSSEDRTVRVWDTVTRQVLHTLEGHTGAVKGCAFSPDGCFIASAGDRTVRVWDTATGMAIQTLESHTDNVTACAYSPDGCFIASVSEDKVLQVWIATTGKMAGQLPLPGSLYALGLHPWALRVVCGDMGGAIYRLVFVGFQYGPIVVTAAEGEKGLEVRCPKCQISICIEQGQLGNKITCPKEYCQTQLKINPFVIKMT